MSYNYMEKKLTIAIPTCDRTSNGILYRCINSIEKQDYKNWRLLIIDDNVQDPPIKDVFPLLEVIESYRYKMDFFPVHNLGLEHSGTPFIFRLDDDFYLESTNFLSILMEVMENNPEYGAISGYQSGEYYHEDDLTYPFMPEYLKGNQEVKFYKTEYGYDGICDLGIQHCNHKEAKLYDVEHIHSSYIYRKEAMEQVGGFHEDLFHGEETIPLVKLYLAGYKIGIHTGVKFTHGGCHIGGVRTGQRFKLERDDEYRIRYQKTLAKILQDYDVIDGDSLKNIICKRRRNEMD